jgi:hypothetical protein
VVPIVSAESSILLARIQTHYAARAVAILIHDSPRGFRKTRRCSPGLEFVLVRAQNPLQIQPPGSAVRTHSPGVLSRGSSIMLTDLVYSQTTIKSVYSTRQTKDMSAAPLWVPNLTLKTPLCRRVHTTTRSPAEATPTGL